MILIINNYLLIIIITINDTYYYMGLDSILPEKCIQRIYPYQVYEKENYKVNSIKPRGIYKGDLYIQD